MVLIVYSGNITVILESNIGVGNITKKGNIQNN